MVAAEYYYYFFKKPYCGGGNEVGVKLHIWPTYLFISEIIEACGCGAYIIYYTGSHVE